MDEFIRRLPKIVRNSRETPKRTEKKLANVVVVDVLIF
jgi:hypothetical protein